MPKNSLKNPAKNLGLLITSVRPLAIIAGKILAMMTAAIIQLLIFTGVSAATFMISLPLGVFSQKNFLASSVVASDFTKLKDEAFEALPGLFNPISISVIILIMLLGFLFYSMLAGIIGAGVSRSEDLIPALQSFSMIALAGFFLSYIPAVSNLKDTDNAMMTFSRFFPLSSPFSLPSAILMGDLSSLEIVAAVFALLVLTFLAALLVAKVYENVILYSGSLLKLSDILKMARNK